jgi:hypothetical protein
MVLLMHKVSGETRSVVVCSAYLLYYSVDPQLSTAVLECLDTTVLELLKQRDNPTLLTGRLSAVLYSREWRASQQLSHGNHRRILSRCVGESRDTQWTL